jgi:CRISPR-associated protein Cmr6
MTTIPYRRNVLAGVSVQSDTHAGLWLDKYLKDDDKGDDNKKSAKSILINEVMSLKVPGVYESFFKRWKKTLAEVGANCREAKTLGRLAVNLGAEGVLETSIALHHTYGVPYIPGSALKGLAAHYVLNYQDKAEWGRDKAFKTLFGDTTTAGYVTFYDALYVPDSGKGLVPDVITVHHPDYYQTGQSPPADWDSPTPIPFITASGRFLIALSGPAEVKAEAEAILCGGQDTVALSGPAEWVKAAFEILELALEREGVGAKTSSGYGRLRFEGAETATAASASTEKKSAVPQEVPPGYQRGVVKTVRETFGFIQPDAGGKDVFVHFNNLAGGLKGLRMHQHVAFKTGPGKKPGEVQALDVRLAE